VKPQLFGLSPATGSCRLLFHPAAIKASPGYHQQTYSAKKLHSQQQQASKPEIKETSESDKNPAGWLLTKNLAARA
jgi:hypothetical protein